MYVNILASIVLLKIPKHVLCQPEHYTLCKAEDQNSIENQFASIAMAQKILETVKVSRKTDVLVTHENTLVNVLILYFRPWAHQPNQ